MPGKHDATMHFGYESQMSHTHSGWNRASMFQDKVCQTCRESSMSSNPAMPAKNGFAERAGAACFYSWCQRRLHVCVSFRDRAGPWRHVSSWSQSAFKLSSRLWALSSNHNTEWTYSLEIIYLRFLKFIWSLLTFDQFTCVASVKLKITLFW